MRQDAVLQKTSRSGESGFDMVDAEIACLLKGQNQLLAAAHTRSDLDREKIKRMLTRTEILLKDLLLPYENTLFRRSFLIVIIDFITSLSSKNNRIYLTH